MVAGWLEQAPTDVVAAASAGSPCATEALAWIDGECLRVFGSYPVFVE